MLMRLSFGIRIGFDKELLGSDEVEHNIIEYVKTIETKHVFGKHVVNKNNIQQRNGLSSTQIGMLTCYFLLFKSILILLEKVCFGFTLLVS